MAEPELGDNHEDQQADIGGQRIAERLAWRTMESGARRSGAALAGDGSDRDAGRHALESRGQDAGAPGGKPGSRGTQLYG